MTDIPERPPPATAPAVHAARDGGHRSGRSVMGANPASVMRYTTFLAIGTTIVALVLSAGGRSSRSGISSTVPAASGTAANPVQRENSRPGTPGWEIPADARAVINGYASETS